MLKILQSYTKPGRTINEDAIGASDHAVWVLDGATSLGATCIDETSDAAWYAQTFNRALRTAFSTDPEATTPDLLRMAMRAATVEFETSKFRSDIKPFEYPSAAFAMARFNDGMLELTGLGDCVILWRAQGGKAQSFGETPLAELDASVVRDLVEARRDHAGLALREAVALLAERVRNNRKKMNTPGGYWILSFDERAIDHINQQSITITETSIDHLSLSSDGFSRLWDTYNVKTTDEIVASLGRGEMATLFETLREIERADSEADKYPRLKISDDATCVVVDIEGTIGR